MPSLSRTSPSASTPVLQRDGSGQLLLGAALGTVSPILSVFSAFAHQPYVAGSCLLLPIALRAWAVRRDRRDLGRGIVAGLATGMGLFFLVPLAVSLLLLI